MSVKSIRKRGKLYFASVTTTNDATTQSYRISKDLAGATYRAGTEILKTVGVGYWKASLVSCKLRVS